MANGMYKKIVDILEHIGHNSPTVFPKYFYLRDRTNPLVCIIDADMINSLPIEICRYSNHDEFYLQINANDKTVMFYAFDIKDYTTGDVKNEATGALDWEKVENQIYSFLVMHLQSLSSAPQPYTLIADGIHSSIAPVPHTRYQGPMPYGKTQSHRQDAHDHEEYDYSGIHRGTSSGFNSDYKERSAFTDKLEDFIKGSKTSAANDFIAEQIAIMVKDEKTDLIDSILRNIWFDRLNVSTMMSLLAHTRTLKGPGRNEFLEKFRKHISKIKPKRADEILQKVEADGQSI